MRKYSLFLLTGLAYAYAVIALGRTSQVYYDSVQYFDYGRNLLETGVYGLAPGIPDMHREPGYGVYLAALFATVRSLHLTPDYASLITSDRIFWVKTLQALALFLSAGLCAYRGGLPPRLRHAFFLLTVLSPTTIGAVREIYSEALAIPLALLFLFSLSRVLAGAGRGSLAGAGVAWAALVLTKSYLYYASFAFLLMAGAAAFRRHAQPLLLASLVTGLAGIAAQKAWDARGALLLGDNAAEPRLSIALAGKVARLDEVDWRDNRAVALAASLGTNFCDGRYGMERCSRFDYRGCDEIGLAMLKDYSQRLGSPRLVDQAMKRDMLRLWFHRPATQLAGSALELLRIAFFEAVLDAGTLPGPMQSPARAWHVAGSALLWIFVLLSWAHFVRGWRGFGAPEQGIALVCAGILVYHAVTMAQITNVVRYVFPVLPFLYYFAADGMSRLVEAKWKR